MGRPAFHLALGVLGGLVACVAPRGGTPAAQAQEQTAALQVPPAPGGGRAGRVVRVALGRLEPELSATGAWRLLDRAGRSTVRSRIPADEAWRVERHGNRLHAHARGGGARNEKSYAGPLIARALDRHGVLRLNGRRYRGELWIAATDSGVIVVNHVGIEDYLRGVVPREIGDRLPEERAAVEAQAVTARSYALARLHGSARGYDVVSGVGDQVYGGVDAETPLADAVVAATRGLVLKYDGRLVSAPYHSTCGGSTAEVPEVWHRRRPEPYLRRVSDEIPDSPGRYYCDASPRFRWTTTFTEPELQTRIDRYLHAYVLSIPAAGVGTIRAVTIDGRTPSGRAASLRIATANGDYALRGDDLRWVLRQSNGQILNSTGIDVQSSYGAGGGVQAITIQGVGYGHGVGMCQWGAIGRARAGASFREILRTYIIRELPLRPRKSLILASLLGGAFVLAPAALLAQDEMARGSLFERLNLDRLRLTALGLGFGYVKPSQIDPTTSLTVHADYGEIAPKWRVVFSATYWGSEYDDKTISTLESALNETIARQGGTDSIQVGRVTVSDIALATDLRYTPLPRATLRPYAGFGLAVHVINAEGRVIDGTLFERSLDNITAGLAGVAGVDLVILRNLRVGVLGRYDLLSAARFPTARLTVAYVFGEQRGPRRPGGP